MDPLAPQATERGFLGPATTPSVADEVDRHLPAPGPRTVVRRDLRPMVVRPQHRFLGDVAGHLTVAGEGEPERHHHGVLAPEEGVEGVAAKSRLSRLHLRHRAHA